jgi:hypothetical protein
VTARNFFYPVLKALEDGKVIRKVITLALQVSAILVLVAGVFLVVQALKFSFQDPSAEGTIGGLLFSAILVITVACVAQIFLYRAGSVRALGESPFTVIPILSILLRTVGETYATAGVAVGVGGCLFVWLARRSPSHMLGPLGGILPSFGDESFLGGIALLAGLVLFSLAFLILFYYLAESVMVFADIATNVRLLVRVQSPGRSVASPPPVLSSPKCPACGAELEEDSEFCSACGVRVRGQAIP